MEKTSPILSVPCVNVIKRESENSNVKRNGASEHYAFDTGSLRVTSWYVPSTQNNAMSKGSFVTYWPHSLKHQKPLWRTWGKSRVGHVISDVIFNLQQGSARGHIEWWTLKCGRIQHSSEWISLTWRERPVRPFLTIILLFYTALWIRWSIRNFIIYLRTAAFCSSTLWMLQLAASERTPRWGCIYLSYWRLQGDFSHYVSSRRLSRSTTFTSFWIT
jgi:hypothetical protein